MESQWIRNTAAVITLFTMGACGGSAEEQASEAPAAAAAQSAPAPDTTGAAIWAHLQGVNYTETFHLWPDKGELYQGTQPHGALLTTYLNDVAFEALNGDGAVMPAGAMVVKENYMPDSTLAAITTMFKVPGYNADHADWFFTKHLASGELDKMPNDMAMEGRLPGCQNCHIAKSNNDYLFTGVMAEE